MLHIFLTKSIGINLKSLNKCSTLLKCISTNDKSIDSVKFEYQNMSVDTSWVV